MASRWKVLFLLSFLPVSRNKFYGDTRWLIFPFRLAFSEQQQHIFAASCICILALIWARVVHAEEALVWSHHHFEAIVACDPPLPRPLLPWNRPIVLRGNPWLNSVRIHNGLIVIFAIFSDLCSDPHWNFARLNRLFLGHSWCPSCRDSSPVYHWNWCQILLTFGVYTVVVVPYPLLLIVAFPRLVASCLPDLRLDRQVRFSLNRAGVSCSATQAEKYRHRFWSRFTNLNLPVCHRVFLLVLVWVQQSTQLERCPLTCTNGSQRVRILHTRYPLRLINETETW
jgi:hypothetical protein